jgi:hypothetical protein
VFFEENVKSDVDVNSFKGSVFVELADMTFGQRQWCLVQYGASCHPSTSSLNALFEVCNIFPEWPPNPPDLNPIEALWRMIKRRLQS